MVGNATRCNHQVIINYQWVLTWFIIISYPVWWCHVTSSISTHLHSVKYIGFIFGVDGIQTDPDQLAAVHDMSQSRRRKEVRQFLSFTNFYRRFMTPNFATIVTPLSSEKKDFRWTSECTEEFNRINHILTTTLVLSHSDFNTDFHIHTDGSGKGVGEVLSQYVDGTYRPMIESWFTWIH